MRLKLSIILFLGLLISCSAKTQTLWTPAYTIHDSLEYQLGFVSEFNINSSGLTNAFLHGFINGRFVTEAEKERMLNRNGNTYRAGYEMINGVFASIPFKNIGGRKSSLSFSLADKQHLNASYTRDAMQLALMGNKSFAGEDAILDGTNANFYRYQEFRTTLHFSLSERTKAGFGLALLKGEEHVSLQANYARLFTHANGTSLTLNTDIFGNQSDTANKGIGAWNGTGTSVQLYIQQQVGKDAWLRLELNDFGFINWNGNSVRYPVDTIYTYRGAGIENIFDLRDSVIEFISPDSLLNDLTSKSYNGHYSSLLPFVMQLTFYKKFNSSDLWVGTLHRFNANQLPYFFGRYRYEILPRFKVGGLVGVGGYGTFNAGLELAYTSNHWCVEVGTRNLEGIAFFRRFGGTSAFVGLKYAF